MKSLPIGPMGPALDPRSVTHEKCRQRKQGTPSTPSESCSAVGQNTPNCTWLSAIPLLSLFYFSHRNNDLTVVVAIGHFGVIGKAKQLAIDCRHNLATASYQKGVLETLLNATY